MSEVKSKRKGVDIMTGRTITIYFDNLTHEELEYFLAHIRPKIRIKGGEETGSGCYLPTRTYDIGIKVKSVLMRD